MKETLHIYLRVSTTVQEEDGTSLKTQKEAGIETSKRLGMLYQIHNEGGMSSSKDTLDNRPVLLNILKQMDEGIIKNLYVWNTDRLSRNQVTWYTIRQKMVKNGVVLYTSNGVHKTTDFMENMVLGILSEVAQYDNMVRTERSRLGKIEKVKLNYWRGGDCPYGYTLENDGHGNKLVKHPDESKWIQYIFQQYAKGIALKDIKAILEENGIKTRRGNDQWSLGTLQVILKNETYLGVDVFTDKKSNLTIKNSIPQLIPQKLWEDVQDRRKLYLQRKGQINRTKHFYLFRDFLICKCSTPMGARQKKKNTVQQYYCPIPERRFNNTYKKNIRCEMKKCMNIPATDSQLWNKIIDILGDSISMSNALQEKTLIGKNINTPEIQSIINEKEERINELTKKKIEFEKGLVTVEADNILNRYTSKEVYTGVKKKLNREYRQTTREIEELRNSLRQFGNDAKWFEWIEMFGEYIKDQRDITDNMKRKLLDVILENILVDYDHTQMLHKLTINFKIPVYIKKRDGEQSSNQPSLYLDATKRGGKKSDQNVPVGNYSTVVDNFSTNRLRTYTDFNEYIMMMRVFVLSSNLWQSPYSPAQAELYNIIRKLHDENRWNFKQISDWLIDHGYKTPRGCNFTHTHAWSIYRKKNRSIQRFSRRFPHSITDLQIASGDYFVPEPSMVV